jgi:hypothetical protein
MEGRYQGQGRDCTVEKSRCLEDDGKGKGKGRGRGRG